MTTSPSAAVWRRAIEEAYDGDPHSLLAMLLLPKQVDRNDKPVAGTFTDLPDDAEVRLAIVRALIFGPWKGATNLTELMTKTGWGKGKPRLSDREVEFAEVFSTSIDDAAEQLGVATETLKRRIANLKRKQRRSP